MRSVLVEQWFYNFGPCRFTRVLRFEDGPDFDHFRYQYTYRGWGPKLGFEGSWPADGLVQIFAKAGGSE